VAAGGDVAQADHGAVVGQGPGGGRGDSGNSGRDGQDAQGQDAQGQGHGGSVEPDLSFGDGATPGQADRHGDQSDHGRHGRDGQNHDGQQEEGGDHGQSGQDHDPSHDPPRLSLTQRSSRVMRISMIPSRRLLAWKISITEHGAHHDPDADLDHA
jgi:hypothetical protein